MLAIFPYDYTLNTGKPRSNILLKMKILEAKGYLVVPIGIENWNELEDFEKIPYLMRAIKEKCDLETLESNYAR